MVESYAEALPWETMLHPLFYLVSYSFYFYFYNQSKNEQSLTTQFEHPNSQTRNILDVNQLIYLEKKSLVKFF